MVLLLVEAKTEVFYRIQKMLFCLLTIAKVTVGHAAVVKMK